MARKLKITASALNVRLHPHFAGTYDKWITSIYRRKIIAPIHGDRHGMISMLDRTSAEDGIVDGIITTFVKLEDDGNWFDAVELDKASEEKKSEIRIPSNLYPNASTFYFRFDIGVHRIYIQNYSAGKYLTPLSTLRFFTALGSNLRVMKEFGEASISIVQSESSIEDMFKLDVIKKVVVTLQRPNNDIFDDDFEKNIEKHLNETDAQEITVTYKAQVGKSIVRDDDLTKLTDAARTNGTVTVTGRDERGAVILKSTDYPEQYHDQFDPEEKSERSAFFGLIPRRRARR